MQRWRKIASVLLLAALLAGCAGGVEGNAQAKEERKLPSPSAVAEEIAEEERILKDFTGSFRNTFSMEGRKIFQNQVIGADFAKRYRNIESLYHGAENIVYGTVRDIQYTDEDAAPRTIYTFQVLDSLKGEIPGDSLVSISESNGFVRLQTFLDVYGKDHFGEISEEEIENGVIRQSVAGAPLPETGERYVLFLGEKHTEGRIAGAYAVVGNFMGKYVLNASTQLYERYQPADDIDFYAFKDPATGAAVREEPMSLEEIEEAVFELERMEQ